MNNNDLILINKILEEESKKTNDDYLSGKFFERFCAEQLLKNYDLSMDDIEFGITDGKDDGGIDAIYYFVNGQLLTDNDATIPAKHEANLELFFITSKLAETFEQAVINSEFSTISEFFDLSKNNNSLTCSYNEIILEKRSLFLDYYKDNVTRIKAVKIHYYFVSRGDENNVGENVQTKANQVVEKTKELISGCSSDYTFIGSRTLLNKYRERKVYDINLPIVSILPADNQKFIVLCKLEDYYKFITDPNGNLKNYIFDSNVRDYNGLNKTNLDIVETLNNNDGVDFWWLNNGITILSSSAHNLGSEIKIENVQIINGLQTSYSIYDCFRERGAINDQRKIMIKIITEKDPAIRDRIIRATNNQTAIQEESLHATDKIQRDIEAILLNNGLYYERRKNYYLNQGVNPSLIISPLYLASSFFAILDRDVRRAITLKQKFMNNEVIYNGVFVKTSLECWPKLIKLFKEVETALVLNQKFNKIKATSKMKILRSIVSLIAISNHFNTFNYNENNIISLSLDEIKSIDYEDIINSIFEAKPVFEKQKWKKNETIMSIVTYCANKYNIGDLEAYTKRKHKLSSSSDQEEYCKRIYRKIKPLIPPQPWVKGIHKNIANKANIPATSVYNAITYGINIGDYYYQKDGALYDKDGNEITISK